MPIGTATRGALHNGNYFVPVPVPIPAHGTLRIVAPTPKPERVADAPPLCIAVAAVVSAAAAAAVKVSRPRRFEPCAEKHAALAPDGPRKERTRRGLLVEEVGGVKRPRRRAAWGPHGAELVGGLLGSDGGLRQRVVRAAELAAAPVVAAASAASAAGGHGLWGLKVLVQGLLVPTPRQCVAPAGGGAVLKWGRISSGAG
jgi:hypothetical protein